MTSTENTTNVPTGWEFRTPFRGTNIAVHPEADGWVVFMMRETRTSGVWTGSAARTVDGEHTVGAEVTGETREDCARAAFAMRNGWTDADRVTEG